MKKRQHDFSLGLSFLVCLAVLVFSTSCSAPANDPNASASTAHADWTEHYESMEEMIDAADLILTGTVSASTPEQRVDLIFTQQTIQIDTCIKGEANAGDCVNVLQTGGTLGDITTTPFAECPLFSTGDTMLLFLHKTNEGHYLVLGGYQGAGTIEDGIVQVEPGNLDDPVVQALHGATVTSMETLVTQTLVDTEA